MTPTTTVYSTSTVTVTKTVSASSVATQSSCSSQFYGSYNTFNYNTNKVQIAPVKVIGINTKVECCTACFQAKDCALFFMSSRSECVFIRRYDQDGTATQTCPKGTNYNIHINQVDSQSITYYPGTTGGLEAGPCLVVPKTN